MGLQDDGPGAALGVGDGEPLPNALRRVVGQPHMTDLAGTAGLLEGGHGLLQRDGLVVEVSVVDVDDIGTQT